MMLPLVAACAIVAQSTAPVLASSAPPAHAPVRGDDGARVTITVFADFHAEPASRAAVVLFRLVELYPKDVKIVFRHHPAQGPGLADRAARAAHAQGKFWELHDLIFANTDRLTRDDLLAMAAQAGLNVDAVARALDSGAADTDILADAQEASRLQLPADLAVFVDGQVMTGTVTLTRLTGLVNTALARR